MNLFILFKAFQKIRILRNQIAFFEGLRELIFLFPYIII